MVALLGGTLCVFVLDAVTFVIAIGAFAGLSIPADDTDLHRDESEGYLAQLHGGIGYLHGSLVQWLLLPPVLANFAFGVLIVSLPALGAQLGGVCGCTDSSAVP